MKNLQFFLMTLLPILIAVTFLTCQSDVAGPGDGIVSELPRDLTQSEKDLIKADQSFSYDIFRRTVSYDTENENVFISPLSISMALAMTLNGANGETFKEMKEALYLEGMDLEEINESFQSLVKLLTTVDPKVQFSIANSVWHEQNFVVKEDFLERLEDYYDAEIAGLDFNDPASKDAINNWVEDKTEGKIKEMIDKIPPEMVMYLINAIYFKGDWLKQFDREKTNEANFYLENGKTVTVDMMTQKENFAVYMSDEVRMIELPYGDSLFTMTVLMPGNPDIPIDQFVDESVTAENLADWRSKLSVSDLPLYLPKFEMEYEIEYNDILKAMGMDRAFDEGRADLSGIADVTTGNLFISEVKHKSFIKVDEEGTEAAAATSVGVGLTSLPASMSVNRPFVFLIYERESGTTLFMGKMKNPTS